MLVFYRKYVIGVCVSMAAALVVVSTAWSALTGQIMAASVAGLISMIVVLLGSVAVSFRVFGAKADAETERLFALYNEQCNPQAFVEEGSAVAEAASTRLGELSSWYLSYFAQALLDVGEPKRAEQIATAQLKGVRACKTEAERAAVATNMVPLLAKLRDPDEVIALIDEALGLLGDGQDYASVQRRTYLELQRGYLTARKEGDAETVVRICREIRDDANQPLRVRVERTWDEAQAHFDEGDAASERTCLEFVVANGGTLALVAPARARLAALDSSCV